MDTAATAASLAILLLAPGALAQVDIDLANDDESFEFRGGAANDHLGGDSAQSVRTIVTGDFNDDGIDDYAIATYDDDSYGTVVLKFGSGTYNQKIYNIANVLDVKISGELSNKISDCIAAGDLNGDGVDDLIIGAEQADHGGVGNTGGAYVYFGTGSWSTPLTLSDADVVIFGWAASSRLGAAVACGNFNGDSYDDLALSSDSYDASTGRVVVLAGQATWATSIDLASAAPLFDARGPGTLSAFGRDIWFADVNADGHDDLFVGAQDQDQPGQGFAGHAGYVYGFHGSTIPDTTIDFEAHGVATTYGLGQRGAGGDINNDGYDDLLVLATDSPSPKVAVFTGSTSGLTSGAVDVAAHALISFGSANSNGIPSAIATGDYDDDGIEDFLVGVSTSSPDGKLFAGSADFFFGRSSWSSTGTSRDFTITGDLAGDYAGQNVCLGDVNGDGYGDIILNSPNAQESGRSNSGQVYTILGRGYAPTSLDIDATGGAVSINVSSRSGRTVTIERAGDLSGPWSEVQTLNTGVADDQVIDSLGSASRQFYRAKN